MSISPSKCFFVCFVFTKDESLKQNINKTQQFESIAFNRQSRRKPGGDEDISEEEEMYVRNKDEVSERGTEAGIRRQMRLQLDHMVCSYSPCIHIPLQQRNVVALSIDKYLLKCVATQVTFSSLGWVMSFVYFIITKYFYRTYSKQNARVS